MKRVYVSTLMVILLSTILVSFSYAQASCCDPGAGCCSTSNISGGQQQVRASIAGPSQAKGTTAKKSVPQINPMPWSASINRIGGLQRLLPAAATGIPGTECCPGTNSTSACCASDTQSTSPPGPRGSTMTEILAFSPFLGTLW